MKNAFPILELTVLAVSRPKVFQSADLVLGVAAWPTDPIGSCTAILSGVHAGCEVRIRDKDSTELAGTESCSENPSFTWSVYSLGSPYNTVRIVVISTSYELIDLLYTSSIGSFSIPIEMREDPWFKDPA